MHINLSARINPTSYGLTGFNFLKSLDRLGHTVSLFPIPSAEFIQADPADHELIKKCLGNAQWFDKTASSIRIDHQFSLVGHIGDGRKIGMTIFEMDRLKSNEGHQILSLDQIIVPSQWAADVVRRSIGIRHSPKISVVPLGYDPTIFYPRPNPRKNNKTVISSYGKTEIRKGHDVLVSIFNKAFTKNDNVELRISWHNQFLNDGERKEWENYYLNSPLGDKIKFLPWLPTQNDVAATMAESDCGIFPSRAEGWGLESLEMLAMGKEIIITDYSAHTEYCSKNNAMLIECPEKEAAWDGKWFWSEKISDGAWAKIGEEQIDQAAHYLRDVHRRKQEGCLKDINELNSKSVEDLTWDKAAQKLTEAVW